MLSANEFTQLRAFIAVAETLSFTRAAAQLGVSPSALSQVVRALEARIGTRLLNRTTHANGSGPSGPSLSCRPSAPGLISNSRACRAAASLRKPSATR